MAQSPTTYQPFQFKPTSAQFNFCSIALASPTQIRNWSHGEVTKAETINYRTQKPEMDGLFCERIFGPVRDFECSCGRYKRLRDRRRGVPFKCEQCGVEVTRSVMRRERMGRIELADPVSHIWFAKGPSSRMGMVLDIPPRELERVLYFMSYIVTDVNEELRQNAIEQIENYRVEEWARCEEERDMEVMQGGSHDFLSRLIMIINDLRKRLEVRDNEPEAVEGESIEETIEKKMQVLHALFELDVNSRLDRLRDIQPKMTLNETHYADLNLEFGDVFEAGMGADAIRKLLEAVDLHAIKDELTERIRESSGQKRTKAIKRLSVIESFIISGNRPEWMVLTVLPVMPPDLHPMVQLDGGRYATSDLNDLYRRVINRNNRLKHLKKLSAPQIILRNERRMLQEAVDALIDNGRRGRAITSRHNHKLKSLTDLLRGKQGRFRQNLLGKRVDYSGRSVIISGPRLKMNECGLPKQMALELFKPFVVNRLLEGNQAHNIKTAKRRTEEPDAAVWDAVEEVVKDHPVLLNRAPTLHRLGFQAFYPRLVEGSSIQLHPLVCTAFNADFDGDQMAVHVPLFEGAIREAKQLMLSTHNMLAPRSGAPIVTPSLDMLLGIYHLTGPIGPETEHEVLATMRDAIPDAAVDSEADRNGQAGQNGDAKHVRFYRNRDEAVQAHQAGILNLREPIYVRMEGGQRVHSAVGKTEEVPHPYAWVKTTVGRVIFNSILPEKLGYYNFILRGDDVEEIVRVCFDSHKDDEAENIYHRHEVTAVMLDAMKELGFEYATRSGTTIAIKDAVEPPQKKDLIQRGRDTASRLTDLVQDGLITEAERKQATVDSWKGISDEVEAAVKEELPNYNGVHAMTDSGAKGNISQIRQMAGMRGLMNAPGKQWSTETTVLETPVVSSLADGLQVHEYFASTHGSRKALTDTALKTAEAGYLTRRMADAAQDVIIGRKDCGANVGIWIYKVDQKDQIVPFDERIAGRYPLRDIVDPETGEVLATPNDLVQTEKAKEIAKSSVSAVEMRSPVGCKLVRGVCARCYGEMLANNRPSIKGEAVGIVAAQSIGEPGTQLTMRNFHTGGTATDRDITTGLPRVQELFEARVPKSPAILSEIAGTVRIGEEDGQEVIVVDASETFTEPIPIGAGYKITVKKGDWVNAGSDVAELTARGRKSLTNVDGELEAPEAIKSEFTGEVNFDDDGGLIVEWKKFEEKSYVVPLNTVVSVADGQQVEPGTQLTGGQRNPHDILETQGIPAVRNYLVDEAQRVYRSQGVTVHDKHFEVIIRQMLSKVKVVSAGDSNLLIDDVKDRREFEEINQAVAQRGGVLAEAKPVLLGISRIALMAQSFLARASFQETERVLTEAALRGEIDTLKGLKENVIIGRMIPANLAKSDEGKKILGLPLTEDEPDLALHGVEDFQAGAQRLVSDTGRSAFPAADLAQFTANEDASTEVGFRDDDDFEPDSEELKSIDESFLSQTDSDGPKDIGFGDE